MKINKFNLLLVTVLFTANFAASGQQTENKEKTSIKSNDDMKTYVIEREIPGAGDLSAEELKGISQTSCSVLKDMGPQIEWLHSYVTDNKIYCVYKAESIDLIREHADKGGFPANSISELSTIISPATAED